MSRRKGDKCTFPDCGRLELGRGLCPGHYDQWRKGKELTPIWWREPSPIEGFENHAEVVILDRNGNEKARAIIDPEDVSVVAGRRWQVGSEPRNYATAHSRPSLGEPPGKTIYMHRLIMEEELSDEVDHWDGNKLNNRRNNLKPVTRLQNVQNCVRPGRELDRNVFRDPKVSDQARPWRVCVQHNKKAIYGGCFATKEEAREAAKALRAKLFTHHNEARHE